MLRYSRAALPAAVLACAAMPAPLLHQALAATAGTLFEAAPFVLAVSLVRGSFVRWTAALLGCGCGPGAGYAALSLPATALCWTVFGPAPALARFAVAATLQAVMFRKPPHPRSGSASCPRAGVAGRADPRTIDSIDPLEQLAFVAVASFATSLALPAMAGFAASRPQSPFAPSAFVAALVEAIAGLVAGSVAPCATAAVAMAAMLRPTASSAAIGILCTAGLIPRLRIGRRHATPRYDARFGLALLCCACLALALHGGRGFIHPRLLPLVWFAIPAAAAALVARPLTSARFGALAPGAMAAALVLGSPLPPAALGNGTLDDLYPGEPIGFTGVANDAGGTISLVRYAITCCRADASAIVLPTNLNIRVSRNAWLTVDGTIAAGPAGTYLRVARWERIAPPADPFIYR
jgi:hypothetical protein